MNFLVGVLYENSRPNGQELQILPRHAGRAEAGMDNCRIYWVGLLPTSLDWYTLEDQRSLDKTNLRQIVALCKCVCEE